MSDILEIPVSTASDPDDVGPSAVPQLNLRHEAAMQRLLMFTAALALLSVPIVAILAAEGFGGVAGFVLSPWGVLFLIPWVAAFLAVLRQGWRTAALFARIEELSRRAGAGWIETTA